MRRHMKKNLSDKRVIKSKNLEGIFKNLSMQRPCY